MRIERPRRQTLGRRGPVLGGVESCSPHKVGHAHALTLRTLGDSSEFGCGQFDRDSDRWAGPPRTFLGSRPVPSLVRFQIVGFVRHSQPVSCRSRASSCGLQGQAVIGRQTPSTAVGSIGVAMHLPPWSSPISRNIPRRPRRLGTRTCSFSSIWATRREVRPCAENFSSLASSMMSSRTWGLLHPSTASPLAALAHCQRADRPAGP